MALLDIESLLAPIAANAPCGPDMEYEDPFTQLHLLVRGKPEQVIGDKIKPAQEPSWPALKLAASTLFASTKDLRVAGILHLALLKTEGLAGAAAGLQLMREMLTRYWDHVHPMLDAEDDNDSTLRVNSLISSLVSEQVLFTLRTASLVESRQFGKHSLRTYRIATGLIKSEDTAASTDLEQELNRCHAAFAEQPVDTLQQTLGVILSALEHLNVIQHVLLDKAGGIPDDLKVLVTDLKDMSTLLEGQLAKRGAVSVPVNEPEFNTAPVAEAGASMGPIRSRTDVIATLERLCEYYAKNEPSSPVPMLLQRAKRLVNKDFMEIIRDLTPGGVSEAEVIGGLENRDR